jgi:hypothetical protein
MLKISLLDSIYLFYYKDLNKYILHNLGDVDTFYLIGDSLSFPVNVKRTEKRQ